MTTTSERLISGFYKARLVKNGPMVPVRITGVCRNGDVRRFFYLVQIGDQVFSDRDDEIHRVWPACYKNRIDEAEFDYLLKLGRWANAHEPDHPSANPYRQIDFGDLEPPF